MTSQQIATEQLCLWQQLRHLPQEERIKQMDDQIRMDRMLREFFSEVRADEYEETINQVRECMR